MIAIIFLSTVHIRINIHSTKIISVHQNIEIIFGTLSYYQIFYITIAIYFFLNCSPIVIALPTLQLQKLLILTPLRYFYNSLLHRFIASFLYCFCNYYKSNICCYSHIVIVKYKEKLIAIRFESVNWKRFVGGVITIERLEKIQKISKED